MSSDGAVMHLDVDEAISRALQQLKVINGNLAVSRAQQAEWQVQEALFTSKLKTRKRAPGSVSSDDSRDGEPKRPCSGNGSLRTRYQQPGGLELEDDSAAHPGAAAADSADTPEGPAEVQRLRAELDAMSASHKGLQERVRDLTAQNEELVIAKNAILSDLMVDDDVQSLREERARLTATLVKRDARILQLEESLAQVKEERNNLQRAADDLELLDHHSAPRSGRATGAASPSKQGSLSSFRRVSSHALDEGASRLKSAVYDELHHGGGSGSGTLHPPRPSLSHDKEASYQQRIIELEHQCGEALAQLRQQRLTHDHIETLGTQLVDLHGELDTLQRALVDAHADPLSIVPQPVLAAALAAEMPRVDEQRKASRVAPLRGSSYVTRQ